MSDSDYVIRIEGLGKRYRIGRSESKNGGMYQYKSLRDSVGTIARRPWSALSALAGRERMDETNSFWALKDVNFDVKRGEVIGIIGRNGAGKSTLLKVLSRITKPTTGQVELRGRVGSLLEVGTGFHPELTGGENIYLNGAVLGMTKAEVRSKFDEIVAFSEVEKFLDMPVKHYSSGMYTRLAFAVAAHLEPEILVVDEVLAVGDIEFQQKCLGKMKDVAEHGRTVFFVSHNMAACRALCGRALLLERGQIKQDGDAVSVINAYLSQPVSQHHEATARRKLGPALEVVSLSVALDDPSDSKRATTRLVLAASADVVVSHLSVLVYSASGTRVGIMDLRSARGPYRLSADSTLTLEFRIDHLSLVEGEYSLGLYASADHFLGESLDIERFAMPPIPRADGITAYEAGARGVVDFDGTLEADIDTRRSR